MPKRFTVIMLTILVGETLIDSGLVLVAASFEARLLFIGLTIVMAIATVAFWMASRHLTFAEVPEGSAAIIVVLGQKKRVIAGPTRIDDLLPFVESAQIESLLQKPLDLVREYDTLDQITVKVTISIVWEVHVNSLLSILANGAKFTDSFMRLIESCLNYQIGSKTLVEVRQRSPYIAEDLRRTLNLPEYCENKYHVRQLAITQLRLPLELTHAAAQLEANRTQLRAARTQRGVKVGDRIAEAYARARELRLLDQSVANVDQRTLDYVENLLLLEYIDGK